MTETKEINLLSTSDATSFTANPNRAEWTYVVLLCGFFLVFNLVTYNFYPAVWVDEVAFAEPAANLVKYGAFTSRVFEYQPPDTFPVVNCPIFPMSMVPWLAMAGTNVLAVRSFNYTFMAIAAMLVWIVSWQFRLIPNRVSRIVMVALLHLGYGMSYSYRCCRPDIIGLIALLLMLLSFKIERQRTRLLCLFGLAVLTVWIGLQVALFAGCAAAGGWIFLRRVKFKEVLTLATGMGIGAGLLALFFWWKGVLSYFLVGVVGLLGKHYAHGPRLTPMESIQRIVHSSAISYVDDFTSVVLVLASLVLLVFHWKRLVPSTRSFMVFALGLYFLIPPFFNLVGHYAFYYSYMRFIPVLLGLFAVYQETPKDRAGGVALKVFLGGAIVAAGMVGLPLRLGLTLACCEVASRGELRRVVGSAIRPTDEAFSEYAVFFEVKERTKVVYDPYSSSVLAPSRIAGGLDLTPEQKKNVSVMVIRPEKLSLMTEFFGGEWQEVSGVFGDKQDFSKLAALPIIGPKFASYAMQPQNIRYQMQIFRRVETDGTKSASSPK